MNKKPETSEEWAAYRCQSSCEIARDTLNKKSPDMRTSTERALYALAMAVSDLSVQVEELSKRVKP